MLIEQSIITRTTKDNIISISMFYSLCVLSLKTGLFDDFRFYEPYHLVAEPFRAAAVGRHFIVCAANFVADGFFC